jgi:hypothetical protein
VATKKDLVEAHSFSRRRLVTAFVSGAPGGREVEPVKPLRAIFGGIALCVLLVAGAAIGGILKNTAPSDWRETGNVVASKELRTVYYVDDDPDGDGVVLRPFLNASSAQIFAGSSEEPITIEQEDIDGEPIGSAVGIPDAPPVIPGTSNLVQSGWTACTANNKGIQAYIGSDSPGTETPGGAVAVRMGNAAYLLTYVGNPDRDYPDVEAFALHANGGDQILQPFGLGPISSLPRVSREWLGLFERNQDPLTNDSFEGVGNGRFAQSVTIGGGNFNNGDVGTFAGVPYLLTESGAAELSPFAEAVYKALNPSKVPRQLPQAPSRLTAPVWPKSWPTGDLSPLTDLCAELVPAPDGPTRRLVDNVPEEARADAVAAGDQDAAVEPGRGAFVRSGTGAEGVGYYLIDSTATVYPVKDTTTVANLGYDTVPQAVVPDTWLGLFTRGVELSADDAGIDSQGEDAAE